KNKFQDMIEMLETANGMISANLIRAQKTALDFSVIHKNEAMAKHLLHQNAKLCSITPDEFRRTFPNLWDLTPIGKEEKVLLSQKLLPKIPVLQNELELISIFGKNHPDLISYLDVVPNKINFIVSV